MSWAEDNGIDIYDPEYDNPELDKFLSEKKQKKTNSKHGYKKPKKSVTS